MSKRGGACCSLAKRMLGSPEANDYLSRCINQFEVRSHTINRGIPFSSPVFSASRPKFSVISVFRSDMLPHRCSLSSFDKTLSLLSRNVETLRARDAFPWSFCNFDGEPKMNVRVTTSFRTTILTFTEKSPRFAELSFTGTKCKEPFTVAYFR